MTKDGTWETSPKIRFSYAFFSIAHLREGKSLD